MDIILGDVFSEIQTDDYRVTSCIRVVCSARPEGFMFMKKYRQGKWDGYINLARGLKFPTGLLKRVHKKLKDAGYTNIRIFRPFSGNLSHYEVTEDSLNEIILRDYQIEAANKLLEAKRGIAKMATNSGKTEVFAAMIKAMGIPKTLVLVTRKELMYQTAERLENRLQNGSIGKIGDGLKEFGVVTVGMIQTISRMSDEELQEHFGYNQLVILDECHHGSAEKMLEVLEKIPGYYRYGFSGTPLRDKILPDLKLIAHTGEIVVEVTNEELINMGHSAKPIVNIYSIGYDGFAESYHEAYEEFIVKSNIRNSKVADYARQHDADCVVLVIVERIEHGNILRDMIPGSVFVNGGDSIEDRMLAIDNMRAGVSGTYIATQIFDEGIDVPAIDVLVLAAGGKSNVRLLQRLGRGLRKKGGDNKLLVYDFIDDTNDYLYNHSLQRIKIYEREGFDVFEISDR